MSQCEIPSKNDVQPITFRRPPMVLPDDGIRQTILGAVDAAAAGEFPAQTPLHEFLNQFIGDTDRDEFLAACHEALSTQAYKAAGAHDDENLPLIQRAISGVLADRLLKSASKHGLGVFANRALKPGEEFTLEIFAVKNHSQTTETGTSTFWTDTDTFLQVQTVGEVEVVAVVAVSAFAVAVAVAAEQSAQSPSDFRNAEPGTRGLPVNPWELRTMASKVYERLTHLATQSVA